MAQGMRWDREERDDRTRYGRRDRGGDRRREGGDAWNEDRSFGGSRDRYGADAYGGGGRRYGGGYGEGRFSEGRGGGYAQGGRGYGDDRRYGSQGGRDAYGAEYGDYGGSPYGSESYGQPSYRGDYGRDRRGSEFGGRDTGFGEGGAYRQGYGGQRVESGGMFGGYEGNTGEHRGRGPKNYTRSDDRIREDVHDRLTDDAWLDASSIDVQVKDGEVTLNGTVENRRDKRRAEDLVDDCSGVKHVQNNLRVQERQTAGETGTTTTTRTGSSATGTTSTAGTGTRQ